MKLLIVFLLAALVGLFFLAVPVAAQDGTPLAEMPIVPAGDCTVEPRSQEEVNALAQIAAATPPSETSPVTTRMPEGDPVDEETIGVLLATLNEADSCAAQRDVLRFLALYSDFFIVRYVFGNEPVGIDAGGSNAPQVNAEGTPVARVNVIDDAVLVEEGIIAAHVFVTGNSDFGSITWFVQEDDGRWIIQDIASAGDPPDGRTDVPAEAEGIVGRVLEDAAAALETDVDAVTVVSFKPVDWSDASLGCPEADGVYAQVVTSGYRIVVSNGADTLTYHTDRQGNYVNCSGE